MNRNDPTGLDIVRLNPELPFAWLPLTKGQRGYIDTLEANPKIGTYVRQLEDDHNVRVLLNEIPGPEVAWGVAGRTVVHPATSSMCGGAKPAWVKVDYASGDALATIAHEMGHTWNELYGSSSDRWQSNFTAQWFDNAVTGSKRWFHITRECAGLTGGDLRVKVSPGQSLSRQAGTK